MPTSEHCGHPKVTLASHCHQCDASPLSGKYGAALGFTLTDARRIILAFAASLAFYALFPWLDFLPTLIAEIIMLGLWSVPGLFFLAALHSSPLLQQLPERFSLLRVALITGVSLACSLLSFFFVVGLVFLLNILAGVPLKAT
jgi:hypothetical protein